jgi:hypothetical protein
MNQKEDEKGDYEGLYRLTDHDDGRSVEKPAIDSIERGFDHENAKQLFSSAIPVKNFELPPHRRVGLLGAGGYQERGDLTSGLA